MKTNKKGISLIVLVITIIVMIILATAIVLSLNDNNMVDRAKEATSMNDLANAKQLVMVAEAEWEMEPDYEKYASFLKYAEEKLTDSGFKVNSGEGSVEVTEDAEVYLYPKIPAGYVASSIEGENRVSTGLVIYETTTPVTNTSARGMYNQYVWVPVEDINEFKLIKWNDSQTLGSSYNTDDGMEAIEYQAMKESVEKYGGFYIARYEAGKDESNYPGVVLSRAQCNVWNQVDWQTAADLCKKVGNDTAVGHLVYGEEWDAALNFISKTDADYATDSTGKGWYSNNCSTGNSTHKTGIDVDTNASNKLNNIYDMAGNVAEWTMERYSSTRRVKRGGYYDSDGTNDPASVRYYGLASYTYLNLGFRPALYLK